MSQAPSSLPSAAGILEVVPEAYVRLDSQFRYTFVNPAAERHLGKTRADLLGKVIWEVCPDLLGTPWEGCYRRAMDGRATVVFEGFREPQQRWNAIAVTPEAEGGIVIHLTDVTERRRAEDALRERDAVLSEAQRIAHVGSWSWELPIGAAVCAWTPETYRVFGVSPDTFVPSIEGFQGLIHPDDRAAMQGWIDACLAGKAPPDLEFRVRLEGGGIRHILSRGHLVKDAANKPIRMIGIAQDITERNQAEAALIDSAAMLNEAGRTAKVGGWKLDLDSNALTWTRQVYLIHEVEDSFVPTVEKAIGFYAPGSRPAIQQAVERAMEHGEAFDLELEIVTARNRRRWVHAIGSVRTQERGARVLSGTFQDITERKRGEKALQESEARYREFVDNSPIGIYRTAPDGQILFANPALLRMLGYSSFAEIADSNLEESAYGPGRERAEFQRIVEEEGQVRNFEAAWARRDGSVVHVRDSARAIRDADGAVLYYDGTVEDITERKRAEEEGARIEAQFHQAQKMESVGRLAGGVAHDFNNLLTVINGYSQMALGKLGANDPLRDSLAEIYKAGERAAGLTRQLLAFSRKQVLEPRRLDINRVVDEMRPMLERMMGEDVEVRVALHAEGATIHADPHQLEQVVMNLAVNSRDAMPRGGKLLIETASVHRDENCARLYPESRPGRYVRLAVSDTGVGLDEATKARIFEPFFTTKGVGKGTGLGLSMVQGIVAQSGGYVEVYSEMGNGTTFKIYLPALDDAASDVATPAAVPAAGGTETVLVVEDQAEVRMYATAVLDDYGYRVISAGNGSEALALCGRERIDLLLTDVVMPHVGGRELADKLAKLQPGMKVLFMSGYTDDAIVHHGVLEEGAKFIQKPFSPEELAGKVRATLGAPAPARAVRILVADDEAGVRGFLRTVLAGGGYEVTVVADGKQALEQARAGDVDLVITDLVMPEQEGIGTIRALRRDMPGVKIIAISGAFGGQYLKAAEMLGADGILRKPVSAESLLAKVSDVLKAA